MGSMTRIASPALAAARLAEPDALGSRLHRELCKSVYARAVRLQSRLSHDVVEGRPWLADARRIVQRAVDLLAEDEATLLGLTAIKALEVPGWGIVRTHAVNVAILSLVLGRKANLGRTHLADVGTSALVHDVGLDATGDPSMHALHGAECLLQLGPVVDVVRPALVALEHHVPATDGDDREGPDLATRIVQIADAYDTLTARGGRTGTPDRVLRHLVTSGDAHVDRSLAKVFAHALGLYPPGTVVQLDSGETGVVLRPSRDARLLDRPLVRIVRTAAGAPAQGGAVVDVAERGVRGFARSIAATLPASPGLMPAAVFLGTI